ncbi:MAG: cell division protein FtsZ [Rhodospirillales bacterium]|nr:cell division protein FtsZ [Rhodospirillales bacterium]
MSINLTVPTSTETPELKPRITVIGVGGAGGNAVNNMIRRELEGVDFVVANTDAQSLMQSSAERRIQLGTNLTQGLGAGSKPEVGRGAAEEAIDEVLSELRGVHMVFIAAGMGGGTGTGAAPVIAEAAREAGILTVGVVTKPFQFEGTHRMRMAEQGIAELEKHVDTLIIIPNQNLFRIANEHTTFADAFNMADEVLYSGVRGVTDLIVMPGLINLDFADIRSVMGEMGKAMMGTGEANGDRRALDAAEAAIANPLLEDMSMKGAKGVLINITGGQDVTLFEVDEAATRIRAEVDADAHIIVGSAFDPNLDGTMRVSVVATGISTVASAAATPTMLNMTDRANQPVVTQMKVLELPEETGEEAGSFDLMGDTPEPEAVADVPEAAPAEPEAVALDGMALEQLIEEIDSNTEALMGMEKTPEATPVADKAEETQVEPATTAAETVSAEEEQPPVDDVTIAARPTMGATDAFIPPKPVSAEPRTKAAEPDPFRAADMANGSRPPSSEPAAVTPGARRPSLFERVTRTGRAAKPTTEEAPASVTPAPDNGGSPRASAFSVPRGTAPAMGAAKPAVAEVPQIAIVAQNEIAGLEPQAAPAREEKTAEDDLLDIPAFLRRQAN